MRLSGICVVLVLMAPAAVAGEWIAGAEGSGSRGQVWLTRLESFDRGEGRAIVVSATASYLSYETVAPGGGVTDVVSPAAGVGVAYRWSYPRFTFQAGPGYEVRWTSRRAPGGAETRRTEHGPTVGAGLDYRLRASTRLRASASYSEPIDWVWSRAAVLQTIGDALRAGPEVAVHGNDDVDVHELGGVVEIGPVAFRAGRARTRFASGLEESQPYFSVGYARRF